jgi:hypothetical protein
MAAWTREDLAKGKISAEAAEKIFTELNTPMEERSTVDTRTEDMKELDAAFPPAKAEDYLIRYSRPGQDTPMTAEIQQFDTAARTWMSSAGLPRELGNSLVNSIEKVVERTATMSAAQLDAYGQTEFQKLQQAYGPELEAKLNAAGRMVVELDAKTPGLKNLLKSLGIGDNAMVAKQLIEAGERYWTRKGR